MPSIRARIVRETMVRVAHAAMNTAVGDIDVDTAPITDFTETLNRLRTRLDLIARQRPMPSGVEIDRRRAGNVWTDVVIPETINRSDRALLLIHGGAFIVCTPETHRPLAGSLARAAATSVWVPDYALAPEHPYPRPLHDVIEVWHDMRRRFDADRIVVVGDSAGGNLALSLVLHLRDEGEDLPAGLVMFSPWLDLTGTAESVTSRADVDPWIPARLMTLPARAYADGMALDDPQVSPLFADLHGLPPTLVQVGSDEVLHDDAESFTARATAAGSDVTLTVFKGMWHVFQAFPIPEATRAIDEVARFVRKVTH